MNDYWFYLETYTFLWVKSDDVLIYNSLSGQVLLFKNNNDISILFRKLLNVTNMYCIKVTNHEFKNNHIRSAINKVRESFSGDIIEMKETKPLSYPPILSFQENRTKLIKENLDKNPISVSISVGDNVLQKLSNLYIYINGACSNNCDNCDKNWKQVQYCNKTKDILSIDSVKKLIKPISSNTNINILGGNILLYPNFEKMLFLLNKYSMVKNYYLHYRNVTNECLSILNTSEKNHIIFLIDFPLDREKFQMMKETCKGKKSVSYYFHIYSEKEYELALEVIENDFSNNNTEIKPLFNGENKDFFKTNIFIGEEDICESKLSKKRIFANQSINMNYFGKLVISANGAVYSNIFDRPIGTLEEDIRTIIYRELVDGISWFRIRDTKPCVDCLYQWLCPPPSNYELAIGKPNLCHIKP